MSAKPKTAPAASQKDVSKGATVSAAIKKQLAKSVKSAPASNNVAVAKTPVAVKTKPKKDPGHPIGTLVMCNWRDRSWRKATVIEREWIPPRQNATDQGGWRYYIHYAEFNRRMDEWADSCKVKARNEPLVIIDDKKNGKGRKRKHDEAHKPAHGHGSGSMVQKRHGNTPAGSHIRSTCGVLQFIEPDHDEHEGMDEASIAEHEQVTKVKNVNTVQLGRAKMDAWYFSPYPKELFWGNSGGSTYSLPTMWVCEFCLKYFAREVEHDRHSTKCRLKHPPGNEIYRHEGISMFEVDGGKQRFYCQNLCYLAKLFLDHKTLYYDVEPFLFYIMCEVDCYGFHVVGYYSKEKYSEQGFNLACILTLPAYQRRGYGRFLIQFSYELSKIEERVGSPEKPLSDLGLLSYRSFWTYEIVSLLKRRLASTPDNHTDTVSIMSIAKATSIKTEDIISTLQFLGILRYVYGKGEYIMCADPALFEKHTKKKPKGPQVRPEKLHWAPLQVDVKRDKWALANQLRHDSDD